MSSLFCVIIVSYNTRDLTRRCLQTLLKESARDHVPIQVWVVDNASRDGSAQMVRDEFPDVHLIASDENLGFGRANNLAMERAPQDSGDFLLLNSDAFVREGALSELLNAAKRHLSAGAIGPRLLNRDESLQPSCWKFPSPARVWIENLGLAALLPSHPILGDYQRWPHDEEREVEFLSGACLLVRRACYQEVGGFDASFFLYAEETDWQKRMAQKGWTRVFTPRATVVHLGGASGESGDALEKMRVNTNFWAGLDKFGRKHYGTRGLVLSRAGMVVGSTLRALCYALLAWANPRRSAQSRRRARSHARLHVGLAWRHFSARAPK